MSSTPEQRRQARAAFKALPQAQRREAFRLARDGVLHRDELVREREVAWARAWSEEFTSARLATLAVIFVLGCLIAALAFTPVIAVVAIFIEAWLAIALFVNWRAARGIRRANGGL